MPVTVATAFIAVPGQALANAAGVALLVGLLRFTRKAVQCKLWLRLKISASSIRMGVPSSKVRIVLLGTGCL